MNDDPAPIQVGALGTVDHVDDGGTVHVHWDDGRVLGALVGGEQPCDALEVVEER